MTPRRCSTWAPVLAGWLIVIAASGGANGDEAPSVSATERATAQRFVEGLRARGYHDLAREYLRRLRDDPATPADQRAGLDYELGRGLLDEAASTADLDRRRALLEQARTQLDAFVRANPDHERVDEALTQIARMLFERGLTAALQASEANPEAEEDPVRQAEAERLRQTRLAEARASFGEARSAYDTAITRLRAEYEAFDKALHDEDDAPEKARRDRVHTALMDAELQRALVDYEDAQTYPQDDPKRSELLEVARGRFKALYDRYRTYLAGLFAHMWEGKCYEEQGKLGEAMGIYNELMDQPAPELGPLKRKAAYFQVIIDGKRGDHVLAVDRARAWLRAYPEAVRTDEGTGVRFELARNLLAQLPGLNPAQQEAATRQAIEVLSDVVRYYSPYKPEALALLRKYKPSEALRAEEVGRLSYEDAASQAESALSTGDWERAAALLRQAIRQADPARRIDQANRARYLLAYSLYMDRRYYEAAILADHLVRHYPRGGLSAKASEIGLAALTMAYNDTATGGDRVADLDRLVEFAQTVASTYPDDDPGDAARYLLGEVALGRGRYAEAVAAFESVRESSPRRLDALVKAGDAHWRHAAALRDAGQAAEADAEAQAARTLMETALAARREARVPETDPGFLANANALAEIHRAEGRPAEALALLEPIVKALGPGDVSTELAPLRIATLTIVLRSHIATGQADAAITDMAALEQTGGQAEALTRLYYELGRSLEREIEALEVSDDPRDAARLDRTRQAYMQFLGALSDPDRPGQSYDSLMFAGEALLALGEAERACAVFDRVIEIHGDDPEFRLPGDRRLDRARLRRAEALRKLGRFDEAAEALTALLAADPNLLDVLMEQGLLYEDRARAEPNRARAAAHWKAAYDHWQRLAGRLQRGRPRRIEYYEALYHVAVALRGMDQAPKAAATLKGVMALSPSVGSPEMKAKYEDLLGQLRR